MDEKRPRTIDEIIDLPLSELTEDEISLLVDWKADIKARDENYQKRLELQAEQSKQVMEIHRAAAEKANSLLETLTAHAIERLESEF